MKIYQIALLRILAAALVLALASCGLPEIGRGSDTPAANREEAQNANPGPQQSHEATDATAPVATAALAPCPVPSENDASTAAPLPTISAETSAPSTPEATVAPAIDCEQLYEALLARYGSDFSQCELGTAAAGSCEKPASLESELKENINIELILDASGSMAETLGGQTKLQIAQQVLTSFVDTLPAEAKVALRVYGHVGSNSEADRARSCQASELLYDFQPLQAAAFKSAIESFAPTGWTPVAGALEAARQDFAGFDPANTSNIIYLVSDGIETCGGDPVAAAKALATNNIQAMVNVVGFAVDAAATEQLRATAEAGGGSYYEARSADELEEIFTKRYDWAAWNAYYRCQLAAAGEQYQETSQDQQQHYRCVSEAARLEYMTIREKARQTYQRGSIDNDCYTAIGARANERYHTILDASIDNYHAALSAAQNARSEAANNASQEYDAILDEQP